MVVRTGIVKILQSAKEFQKMFGEKKCSLTLKLVEDLPGEHTYIHCCRSCGREYDPEFVVFHASTGRANDPVPVVSAPICVGRKNEIVTHGSEYFEAIYRLGLVAANA
jgi:hypothetical protein